MLKITKYFMLMFILVGCSSVNDKKEESVETSSLESSVRQEESISINLIEDGTSFMQKDIEIKPGALLGDVMADNFDVGEDNGMIVSIDGRKQNAAKQKYWLYEVNDEFVDVGANEYKLKSGDSVTWKLEKLTMEE